MWRIMKNNIFRFDYVIQDCTLIWNIFRSALLVLLLFLISRNNFWVLHLIFHLCPYFTQFEKLWVCISKKSAYDAREHVFFLISEVFFLQQIAAFRLPEHSFMVYSMMSTPLNVSKASLKDHPNPDPKKDSCIPLHFYFFWKRSPYSLSYWYNL